jgi:hypothetical protein
MWVGIACGITYFSVRVCRVRKSERRYMIHCSVTAFQIHIQSNLDIAPLFVQRSLWQYVEGVGCIEGGSR